MNRVMIVLSALFTGFLPLLIDSAMKGAALLLVAAISVLILRKASGAIRHFVWVCALGALLVLPILSVLLPSWTVLPRLNTAVAKSAPSANLERPFQSRPDQAPVVQAELLPASGAASVLPIPPKNAFHVRDWLPLVWAAGFALLVTRVAVAQWFLSRAGKRSIVVRDGRLAEAKQDAWRQLNVGRPVELLLDPHRTIPMAWGVFRPRVLLPTEAADWDETRLRAVLLHEMAHIKRGDAVVRWLAQLSCALHWFNPLVWFAAWRLRVESERACDDLVLTNGVRASDYAQHLLHVATTLSPARMTQTCGLAMAFPSGLEGRLLAVLNQRANRRRVTRPWALAALALGLCVVVPIAMLHAASDKTSSVAEKNSDYQKNTSDDTAERTSDAEPRPADPADAGSNEVNHAKLLHAESNFQRARELHDQSLISEAEFNRAKAEMDIAGAEFAGRKDAVAQINLKNLQAELVRLEELHKANLVSKYEVDQMNYQVALLGAEVSGNAAEAARIRLQQAEEEFKHASQLHQQNVISEAEYQNFLAQVDVLRAKARASGIVTPPPAGKILVEARVIEGPATERMPEDPSSVTNSKGVKVLSSPSVVASIGEEAEIFIGNEQPADAALDPRDNIRTGITMRVRTKLQDDRIAYTVRLTLSDLVRSEVKDTQTIHETSSGELHVSGTAKDGEGTWFHINEHRNDRKKLVISVWLRFKRLG